MPIGIIGTVAAGVMLVEQYAAQRSLSIDWWGSVLYMIALLSLMTSMAFGGIYGWTTWWVIGGFVLFLIVLPIFLRVESRVRTPLLDLSLFQDRLFTMGNLTGLLNGVGLAGLLTLAVDTPYWQLALWQLIIGAGAGIFASPNTSAVMGVVPPEKRGIGAGMRSMLTNTGFVISIALAIGLMTSSMDPKVLVAVFAGTQTGSAGINMGPFINALHIAFAAGVVASAVGAGISLMRGEHRSWAGSASVDGLIRDVESGADI